MRVTHGIGFKKMWFGEHIRFWYDVWRGGEPLLGKYPILFSKSLNKDAIGGD